MVGRRGAAADELAADGVPLAEARGLAVLVAHRVAHVAVREQEAVDE